MNDKRIELMRDKPVPKAIVSLALPAVAGMLSSAVYNLVDTFFVGKLGYLAIGATQIVMPIMMLIGAVGMTLGVGAASFISRLLGRNEMEQANRVAATTFYTTILVGLLLTAVGVIFLRPIIALFGATEDIMPYAMQYGRYIVFVAFIQMLAMVLNNMLRAEGSARESMVGMIAGAVLNIILDPIFIFALDMGVAGAAIATGISQIVSVMILLSHYLKRRSLLHIRLKDFTPKLEIYGEVIKIGAPTLLRQGLFSVAMAIMNNVAASFGDTVIAAYGIVNRVFSIAFFLQFGIAQGFQPMAGYNYGSRDFDRLQRSIWFTMKLTTVLAVLSAAMFAIFAPGIVKVFQDDPEVVAIGTLVFRYMSIFLPFMGGMITINILYQAMGRAIPAALLSLARQGIFFIPIILTLPKLLGLDGLILAQPAADLLTLLLTALLGVFVIREVKAKAKLQLRGQGLEPAGEEG